MSTTAQVSVVIPTRNRCALLARTLATVLAQRQVELEVFVVDEASTDGTASYLARLRDRRVSAVRHGSPQGVAAARNAGLERAGAPWVAFVDDDDLWAPDKLAAQLAEIARRRGTDWGCVGAVVLDSSLCFLKAHHAPAEDGIARRLLSYNVIPGGGSGVLARTSLVRALGGFDPSLRLFADWDLWIRLALASPVAAIDEPLIGYLLHGGNMTSQLGEVEGELRIVAHKHASARACFGAEIDRDRWLDWAADMQRRSGQRRAPAAAWMKIAVSRRSPRAALRAGAAAAWPGWARLRERRAARSLPDGWHTQAETWLAPLRRAPARSTPDLTLRTEGSEPHSGGFSQLEALSVPGEFDEWSR